MSETALQNRIRLELGKLKNTRIFRNNVGMIGGVQFGLCKSSADLIGFRTVTITPEMVGQEIAQFVSIEVKTPTGKVSDGQKKWRDMVNLAGGIGAIVRSVDDAVAVVESR
jgi:hypothetical protein